MQFLITSNFNDDFELIEAPDKLSAEAYIYDMLNHNEPDNEINVIYSGCDSATYDTLIASDPEILYIDEYEY